jgi:phosphate butyryltransferase
MELLKKLLLSDYGKNPCTIAVAAAADLPVLKAIQQAYSHKLIIPLLIGETLKIKRLCDEIAFDYSSFTLIEEPDPKKAAHLAVQLIKEKKADILMKGMVTTAQLLKAVVQKDGGLRKNPILSHFALFESPYYHKLLGITDAAMNISPTLEEKADIIRNATEIMHLLGYTNPKIAVVTPLEMINEKIESTVHAAELTQMNRDNLLNGCIIEGPLALDNAISKEAAEHKGIKSVVAGEADVLLVPDLNSGNVLYKSLIFLGGAISAGVIAGAKVPIVLTSRSDSEHSKLLSIALAAKLKDCSSLINN